MILIFVSSVNLSAMARTEKTRAGRARTPTVKLDARTTDLQTCMVKKAMRDGHDGEAYEAFSFATSETSQPCA